MNKLKSKLINMQNKPTDTMGFLAIVTALNILDGTTITSQDVLMQAVRHRLINQVNKTVDIINREISNAR